MCGIVGFINQQSDLQEKKRIVNVMMDTIIHRGPNSSGEHVDEGAALGFRRQKTQLDHLLQTVRKMMRKHSPPI